MPESSPTPDPRVHHDGKRRVPRGSNHLRTIGRRVYPTLAAYATARNVKMFLGSLNPPAIALGRRVERPLSSGVAGLRSPQTRSARRGRSGQFGGGGTPVIVMATSESSGDSEADMCGGVLDGGEKGDESDEEGDESDVGSGRSHSVDGMWGGCVEWFEEGYESNVEAGGSQSTEETGDMCVEQVRENESDIEAGGRRYGEGRGRDIPQNGGGRVFMECVMIVN